MFEQQKIADMVGSKVRLKCWVADEETYWESDGGREALYGESYP